MRFSWIFLVPMIMLLDIETAQADERYKLSIGTHVISTELATTDSSREHGLMHRRKLCTNCGMLFIFPVEDRWAFWSKNTPLALSVAFIDNNGVIISISDMSPDSLDIYTSPQNVAYALEMPRGWFSQHKIKNGERFSEWHNGQPTLVKLLR